MVLLQRGETQTTSTAESQGSRQWAILVNSIQPGFSSLSWTSLHQLINFYFASAVVEEEIGEGGSFSANIEYLVVLHGNARIEATPKSKYCKSYVCIHTIIGLLLPTVGSDEKYD